MGRYDDIKYFDGNSFVPVNKMSIFDGTNWVDLGEDDSEASNNFNIKIDDSNFRKALKTRYLASSYMAFEGKLTIDSSAYTGLAYGTSNSSKGECTFQCEMLMKTSGIKTNLISYVLTYGSINVFVDENDIICVQMISASSEYNKTSTIQFPINEWVNFNVYFTSREESGYTIFDITLTKADGTVFTEEIKIVYATFCKSGNSVIFGGDNLQIRNIINFSCYDSGKTEYVLDFSSQELDGQTEIDFGNTITGTLDNALEYTCIYDYKY